MNASAPPMVPLRGRTRRLWRLLAVRIEGSGSIVARALRRAGRALSGARGADRYAPEWYARLYAALGTGFLEPGTAGRAEAAGGLRCPARAVLRLLPGEEAMFAGRCGAADFRLGEDPAEPGRKTITCDKRGHCGGRMPYVCRTAPAQFSDGLFYLDEARCAGDPIAFLAGNGAKLDRLRAVVEAHDLRRERLGYHRATPLGGAAAPAGRAVAGGS